MTRPDLTEALLTALGLGPDFCREIHPKDEMLLGLERLVPRVDRRALTYFLQGHQAWASIDHAVATANRDWGSVESVLDFACGYGRSTRFLVQALPADRVWASDIDVGATTFVADSLGVHGVPSCADPEDLDFGRQFEVIYVGSLFSHLPEQRFGTWLRKLYDLLVPGGILLFSTHSMKAFPEEADASGFAYRELSETTRLDTSEYGFTIVTPDWVRKQATEAGIVELHTVERELWLGQDLHAAVNQPIADLQQWTNAPVVHGSISEIRVEPPRAGIGGSAHLASAAGTVDEVTVRIGKLGPFATALRSATPAPEDNTLSDTMHHYEWHVEGDASQLTPGSHAISVFARVGDRAPVCFDVDAIEMPPAVSS